MAEAGEVPAENLDAFKEQLIKASARIVLAVIVVLCVTFYLYMPTKKQLVQQVITRDRRSVIKFKGKVPMPAVLRALRAAIHAPNHFLNEPWRFRLLGPETQKKILQLNESKRELLESVPGWLMVSVVPTPGESKWNVKALEDHAATACAVQKCALPCARARSVASERAVRLRVCLGSPCWVLWVRCFWCALSECVSPLSACGRRCVWQLHVEPRFRRVRVQVAHGRHWRTCVQAHGGCGGERGDGALDGDHLLWAAHAAALHDAGARA